MAKFDFSGTKGLEKCLEAVNCSNFEIPRYIDPKVDEAIRQRLPIRLPREAMEPGCGRW